MPIGGNQIEVVELGLKDAVVQAWRKCATLNIPLVGEIGACLEIDASPSGDITFTLEVKAMGSSWKWPFTVNGNKCFKISLVGPLAVELCVSGWNVGSGSVSFTVEVAAVVDFGFYKKRFTLISETITIPLPEIEEIEGLESVSSENLLAVLALLGAEVKEQGADADATAGHCRCGQVA